MPQWKCVRTDQTKMMQWHRYKYILKFKVGIQVSENRIGRAERKARSSHLFHLLLQSPSPLLLSSWQAPRGEHWPTVSVWVYVCVCVGERGGSCYRIPISWKGEMTTWDNGERTNRGVWNMSECVCVVSPSPPKTCDILPACLYPLSCRAYVALFSDITINSPTMSHTGTQRGGRPVWMWCGVRSLWAHWKEPLHMLLC